jgi:protein-arginine kinase activator protein McsA
MEHNPNTQSALGFYSADGSFHQLSTLTVDRLEFVSRSRLELETMLKQYILSERYEKCALIRDELLKR